MKKPHKQHRADDRHDELGRKLRETQAVHRPQAVKEKHEGDFQDHLPAYGHEQRQVAFACCLEHTHGKKIHGQERDCQGESPQQDLADGHSRRILDEPAHDRRREQFKDHTHGGQEAEGDFGSE